MAGVKGKSGGARPNSGGRRKGAGRPRREPHLLEIAGDQRPLEFLLAVMADPTVDGALRVRAAIAAAPYVHARRAAGGKKEEQAADAITAHDGTDWESLLDPGGPPQAH